MKKSILTFSLVEIIISLFCVADDSIKHSAPILPVSKLNTSMLTIDKAIPTQPPVIPDINYKFWVLTDDMVYKIGHTNEQIVVPKGFVTDFASIPQPLWRFGLSPNGKYSRAAVIHDYLYWAQGCNKNQADKILLICMKETGVGKLKMFVIYKGVDKGGKPSWEKNKSDREQGYPKIVPEKYLDNYNPNEEWPKYMKRLFNEGVHDPKFEQNPSYCKYGNSTDIP